MKNYHAVSKGAWLKLYIDGHLHLCLRHGDLLGFQSWVSENFYCIEFYMADTTVLAEYDKREKWQQILDLLDCAFA